jgi:hypothetical protein
MIPRAEFHGIFFFTKNKFKTYKKVKFFKNFLNYNDSHVHVSAMLKTTLELNLNKFSPRKMKIGRSRPFR